MMCLGGSQDLPAQLCGKLRHFQSVSLKVKGSIGEMSMLVDTMASEHGREDKGSIRDIMVVMKRSSRGVVLVDLRAANLYQGII